MGYQIISFLFGVNHGIDRVAFWTGIAAVAAIVAIFIAYVELDSARKTARADFANRFVEAFFTKETRELFTLLMNSALEFDVLIIKDRDGKQIDRLPYLKIRKEIAKHLQGLVMIDPARTGYSAFEIDDLLLGFFDDIGWYVKKKLVDFETIEQTFGYYVAESYDNPVIQDYLNDKDNRGRYIDFRNLAQLLNDGVSS